MTEREKLEVALAKAESAQAYLEAFLAEAQAALVNAVTDASKIDANRAEANANVEKTRARCRQLRTTLANPSLTKLILRLRERMDTVMTRSLKPALGTAAASIPPMRLIASAAHAKRDKAEDNFLRENFIHRGKKSFAKSPHVRESIGLLALTLAYLQYYYFDVQLQILNMPSIFTFLID